MSEKVSTVQKIAKGNTVALGWGEVYPPAVHALRSVHDIAQSMPIILNEKQKYLSTVYTAFSVVLHMRRDHNCSPNCGYKIWEDEDDNNDSTNKYIYDRICIGEIGAGDGFI